MTITEANSGRRSDAALQSHLAPSRLGQATAVEQSRAIAEVQAAIVVAQQCPRDEIRAVRKMTESCKQPALAARAFFAYPRGRETISGPSVHLARELARTWGNIQYGVAELRRDDGFGQSEMLAFAWDVETNTRASHTFIVPHRRDTKDGPKALTDMRDIYESNANNGARRVREAIFGVLPTWFTEQAKSLCAETLADGGGKPLAQRILDAVESFGNISVTEDQLERNVGQPSAKWTAQDVVKLGVIYTSLMRNEVSRDEVFPPARVTAADITGQQASPDASSEGAEEEAAHPGKPKGQPAPPAAVKRMEDLIAQLQLGPRPDVDDLIFWLCPGYTATRSEVTHVTNHLADHLEAAKGDLDAASTAIWTQMKTAEARDASGPPEAP